MSTHPSNAKTQTQRMGTRLILASALLATFAAAAVWPSAVRAEEPLRSGTITGWGYTWPGMFNGAARDCQWSTSHLESGGNPECGAWMATGCDPALAGRDPAVTASIEDVADLADSRTPRRFEWRSDVRIAPSETEFGGVVVQFWTEECTEVAGRWRSKTYWDSSGGRHNVKTTSFSIPRNARWMTVTTNDTIQIKWTLT